MCGHRDTSADSTKAADWAARSAAEACPFWAALLSNKKRCRSATRALLASRSTSSECISERKTSNSATARFFSKILVRSAAWVNLQSRLLNAFTVAMCQGLRSFWRPFLRFRRDFAERHGILRFHGKTKCGSPLVGATGSSRGGVSECAVSCKFR